MGEGSSGPGPVRPAGAGDGEATQAFTGREPVTWPQRASRSPHPPTEGARPYPPTEGARPYQPTERARPYPPTEGASPYQPTEGASPYPPTQGAPPYPPTQGAPPYPPTEGASPQPPMEVVRYGPGVPATPPTGQAGLTAERVWRTGRPPESSRRPARLRRWFGLALTVILLAASGVVLYLRFHHAPFHVTADHPRNYRRAG
jgi:hypothetical protein